MMMSEIDEKCPKKKKKKKKSDVIKLLILTEIYLIIWQDTKLQKKGNQMNQ